MDATLLSLGVESDDIPTAVGRLGQLVDASMQAEAATESLGKSTEKRAQDSEKTINAWTREAATANLSRQQIIQLEAQYMGLSQTQMESVRIITQAMEAQDLLKQKVKEEIDLINQQSKAWDEAHTQQEKMNDAADAFVANIQRQANALGKSKSEIAAMTVASTNLTASQRQQADVAVASIKAFEQQAIEEKKAADAAALLSKAWDDAHVQQKKINDAANTFVANLKAQAEAIGKTKSELAALTVASTTLTDAQRKEADAAVAVIRAHEDQVNAAKRLAEAEKAVAAAKDTAARAQREQAAQVKKDSDQMESSLMTVGRAALHVASVIGVALVAAYYLAKNAAEEAEQASLRLDVALKASGNAAGLTKKELDAMADSFAAATKFDDETIRNAQASLLQFQNIGSQTFERVLRAATDLAAFMGTDLPTAAKAVGRAMEDPVQGATALRRAGILLSESQRQLIKDFMDAGEEVKAQNVILEALEKRLGGAAETMNTGTLKATNDFKKSVGELTEEIGKTDGVTKTWIGSMESMTTVAEAFKQAIAANGLGVTVFDVMKAADDVRNKRRPITPQVSPGEAESEAAAQQVARAVEEATRAADRNAKAVSGMDAEWKKMGTTFRDQKEKLQDTKDKIAAMGLAMGKLPAEILAMQAAAEKSMIHTGKTKVPKETAEMKLLEKEYDQFVDLLDEASVHGARFDKGFAAINDLLKKGVITQNEYNQALRNLTITTDEVYKAQVKALEETAKAREKDYDAILKSAQAMDKEAEKIRDHTANLGKSKEQIELREAAMLESTIALKEMTLAAEKATDADGTYISVLEQEIAALKNLTAARKAAAAGAAVEDTRKKTIEADKAAAKELYDFIDHAAAEVWGAMADKAESAWKKIRDTFKSTLLAAIYKMAVQPLVFNIVANITGVAAPGSGGAVSGAAGLLNGGQGGTGGLGSIMSLLGSSGVGTSVINGMISLGSSLGIAAETLGTAAAFTAAAGSTMGAAAATLGIAAEAGVAAVGGITAVMGAAAAFIPVVGWIAAAAYLAYTIFSKPGGGPKAGGNAVTGNISGITGTDNSGTRYFTPNQSDSELQKTVDAATKGYADIVKALGLTKQDVGFALGFDTDPQGTAPNRTHAGTFVNGVQVYDSAQGDLGRDEKKLQEQLVLESKRIIFAALQASMGDAPEYMKKLFAGVDVNTVTSEQIDEIVGMAQALKLIVDTMGNMGDKFASLDVDQMKDLVEQFGGLQNFLAGAQFMNANFTTAAEQRIKAEEQVGKAFKEAGFELPKTHAGFMALIDGLDLTDEAQRKTYATLIQLAPAFIALNGTAEEAAQKIRDLRAAIQQFNVDNLLTDDQKKEQATTNLQGLADLYKIPDIMTMTHSAFLQLMDTMGLTDEQTLALSQAFVAVRGTAQAAAEALNNEFQDNLDMAANVGEGGTFGQRASLQLSLIPRQIAEYQARLDALRATDPYSPMIAQYQSYIDKLRTLNAKTADQLARYTILAAQYGDAKATELVALQDWYAAQQEIFAGFPEDLAILKQIFDARWKGIIEGTDDANDQLAEKFKDIQKTIRELIDSLKISDLSPLSPQAKLNEAERQYFDLLAKARTGDLDAMAKLPQAAQDYLALARDFYASSQMYTDIFNSVIGTLEEIANMPQPEQLSEKTDVTPIVNALPTSGRLASSDDVKELAERLIDAIAASANARDSAVTRLSRDMKTKPPEPIGGGGRGKR